DGEALAPLARRIARTYLRFAVANAKALEEAPKGPLAVELANGVPFQAARAGYNRKCLQALLGELDAAVAAAGRLEGGAADREIPLSESGQHATPAGASDVQARRRPDGERAANPRILRNALLTRAQLHHDVWTKPPDYEAAWRIQLAQAIERGRGQYMDHGTV